METFWSWKHHKSSTEKPAPGCKTANEYIKIRANSIEEAQEKAEKHYKYDFFYSTFSISTINHDGSRGLLHTGPDIPAEHKKKVYEAYQYFHSLEPEMQERVYNHYKEFGDDWKGQDKTDLRFLVALLRQEK